jgi:hypothetical protein
VAGYRSESARVSESVWASAWVLVLASASELESAWVSASASALGQRRP